MKTSLLGLLASILALSSGTGCIGSKTCTTEAITSVGVTVVDDTNAPVTDATLVYSVDGKPQKSCEHTDPTSNTYYCAYEEAGHFVITATRGTDTAQAQVDVSEGECHVVPATTTITLPAR
jgi:hypothetical protein